MNKELEALNILRDNHIQFTKEKYGKLDKEKLENIINLKLARWDILEEAIKRNEPMKPIKQNDSFGLCPICKQDLGRTNYCDNCGQRLDWESNEK